MFDLILTIAKGTERIRAVILNGSRANPNAPKDMFQDYDIVYVVKDLQALAENDNWIDAFGRRFMLQMPERMRNPTNDGRFTYLMLLEDGNRIDLQLIPFEKREALLEKTRAKILLLDKDGVFEPFAPASDSDFYLSPPTENDYFSCCNNFWWCLQNVAKGIWRDELPYAMAMVNQNVREELHCMMEWYIGVEHGFSLSTGKMGKYYKRYLDSELYEKYVKTYSDGNYENFWNSLFCMCDLFRELAIKVGLNFDYAYLLEDERRMTAYLRHVRGLLPTATEIY